MLAAIVNGVGALKVVTGGKGVLATTAASEGGNRGLVATNKDSETS